jgi:hypothetical protein
MKFFENLLLNTPYRFLRHTPYAWVALIMFWIWPPDWLTLTFAGLIVLGLVLMVLQRRFWEQRVQREYQKQGEPYRSHPRMPVMKQLRNLALVLAGSALLAFLLGGRLGINGVQWFLLIAGLVILWADARLFGASTIYLVTPRGIAVQYAPGQRSYRWFFHYAEINYIARIHEGEKLPPRTEALGPVPGQKEGVLLVAKRMDGFSSELGAVLLTPEDPEEFLKQIPSTLIEQLSVSR